MTTTYEVERRFLVSDRQVVRKLSGNIIVQAYLFVDDGYSIRVRRTHVPTDHTGSRHDEGPAMLAAKGPRYAAAREEYEFEVPAGYATELIKHSQWKVSKTRYQIIDADRLWDIDEFHGANKGLMIAECESHDIADLEVPRWCCDEVTDDPRFDNEMLAKNPYSGWQP